MNCHLRFRHLQILWWRRSRHLCVRHMKMVSTLKLVITEVPPGEAPLWVREKWVGLSIPLVQSTTKPLEFRTTGLLTGPLGFWGCLLALFSGKLKRETGFLVESKVAIDLLSKSAPEAANWWSENTPHLLGAKQYFVFHENCGHAQTIE